MSAQCRSCDAPIVWALTAKGRRMPLDAQSVVEPDTHAGLFRLEEGVALSGAGDGEGPYYRSHFATCPNAREHRRSTA